MNHEVGTELFKIIANANVLESRLIIFDNSDHYVHLEYPELYNRTVKSFCGKYSLKPVE